MRIVTWLFAAALSLGVAISAHAQGSRRASDDYYGRKYALVIGNGAYERSPLKNPVNDATDIADSLKKTGFKVTLQVNAGLAEMRRMLADFQSKLPGDAAALIFYAGHGVQYQGQNYLIPIDAINKVNVALDLPKNALALAEITQQLSSDRKGISVIILDACRDSPFTNVQSIEAGLSRSTGLKDLKAIDGTKPNRKAGGLDGVMFAYSTAPDATASDGAGRNSPYSKHLKEFLRRPNTSVETVLKLTRIGVTKETTTHGILKARDRTLLHGKMPLLSSIVQIKANSRTHSASPSRTASKDAVQWSSPGKETPFTLVKMTPDLNRGILPEETATSLNHPESSMRLSSANVRPMAARESTAYFA